MRALALAGLLLAGPAIAAAPPRARIRAHLVPRGPVVEGQHVKLVVDVLVTTWFQHEVALPSLEVPGALVTLPAERPADLTENVQGVTWFGQSRAYIITPERGGRIDVPPFEVTVVPGEASGPIKLRTPSLSFEVREIARPPGAEDVVATTRLVVEQRFDRPVESLRVGDAFTRTVEVEAQGVQGMFLPELEFQPVEGLALYPRTPRVEDVSREREGLVGGRRVEAVTYVVKAAGEHTLPAISVSWWDTRGGRLRTTTAGSVTFTAAPTPAYRPEISLAQEQQADPRAAHRRIDWKLVGVVLAGAGLLVLLGRWVLPPLRRRWVALRERHAERVRRHEASEPWAFEQLVASARSGTPADLYRALLRWLERFRPGGRVLQLADLARTGGPDLARSISELQRRLFSSQDGEADGAAVGPALVRGVRSLRDRLGADGSPDALAPLNPI